MTAPASPVTALRFADVQAVPELTTREQEIAIHVARGLSNREVAEAPVVSRRTVEWHVANLLAKLGLRSRSQLVLWVAEHGSANLSEDLVGGSRA
jgi:non-specific serine/threonine protein kinase